MKITKSQLKQIIKEELEGILAEASGLIPGTSTMDRTCPEEKFEGLMKYNGKLYSVQYGRADGDTSAALESARMTFISIIHKAHEEGSLSTNKIPYDRLIGCYTQNGSQITIGTSVKIPDYALV